MQRRARDTRDLLTLWLLQRVLAGSAAPLTTMYAPLTIRVVSTPPLTVALENFFSGAKGTSPIRVGKTEPTEWCVAAARTAWSTGS